MRKQTFIQRGMRLLMTFALLAVMTACSSTQIQSSRHPAGMSAAPFRNAMVVGVDQRPEVRDPFENEAVLLLREHGVAGTASYNQFSFAQVQGDKEQLRQNLKAAGVQSLLFVRVTQRTDFVDGPPASLGSMDMGAVDESQYVAFTTPGGDINTRFRIGARLYRVSDGAVIWSAVLDEVMKEDADSTDFIRRTARTIVDRLAKDKVIP
jgi:hypothetical protein